MKNLSIVKLGLLSGLFAFTVACSDDDADIIPPPAESCTDGVQNQNEEGIDCGGVCAACSTTPDPVTLSGLLNTPAELNLTNDRIYFLSGRVVVAEGQTLNIAPGTIFKGLAGTGSLAAALIVPRGAKINAVGTPTQPIIFTSEQDNIQVGQTAGTNLDENDNGLWGGVLILGNAPASLAGDVTENQIEGIPASDTFGLYGGNNPADDSGDLAYISIRHGGAIIGEGNEINGLTLGGIGSGTSVSNIEIVGNEDDGIEIFGGTLNVSNVLVWAGGDDGIDLDEAWTGTLDNAVVVQGVRSDSAMELDGPAGSLNGAYTLTNITLFGNTDAAGSGSRRIADFRDGLQANLNNIYVTGFLPSARIRLNGDKSANSYNAGNLLLSNWEVVLPTGITNVNELLTTSSVTVATTFLTDGPEFLTAVTTPTVGANLSAFAWTYANAKANLGF